MPFKENIIKMDDKKASIISVFPFEFREVKPGIHPGYYYIEAAKDVNTPSITIIQQARYYIYLGDKRNFPVDVPAIDVARSLVRDLIMSMVEADEDAHAGLIAVEGMVDEKMLIGMKDMLDSLREIQVNWFRKLVDLADKDYARVKSPVAVSDLQRMAAKTLNLQKEWGTIADAGVPIKCPACQTLIPKESVVCQNCRFVINPSKYKELQFATQGA